MYYNNIFIESKCTISDLIMGAYVHVSRIKAANSEIRRIFSKFFIASLTATLSAKDFSHTLLNLIM